VEEVEVAEDKTFVGVDVCKRQLEVAVRPSGSFWSESNDRPGVHRLVKRLKEMHCKLIVIEATGGYQNLLAAALRDAELPVQIVNPRWVRDFARAHGQLAKTDKLDAKLLALYAERTELELRVVPDEETLELRALCTRRDQLMEMLVAEQNRLEHAPKRLQRAIEDHIDYLRKQLKRLDDDIDRAVRGSKLWRAKHELLRSIPGVGPVLSAGLIARLPELGETSRGEIAKLVGVAPLNWDSGKLRGIRAIAGGRASLRRTLYMCAVAATRCNPVLHRRYQQLREHGKPPKVALVAVMRKLLLILNAIVKTRTPWRQPCGDLA
jgi:transposase